MLENDRMETASTGVTSIWRRNNTEKTTWRTHPYFVDFESRIHVEISTSNRCHNFHVYSPFKIDVISTNFPRGISTSNRWRIDEYVSIGLAFPNGTYLSMTKTEKHCAKCVQSEIENKCFKIKCVKLNFHKCVHFVLFLLLSNL